MTGGGAATSRGVGSPQSRWGLLGAWAGSWVACELAALAALATLPSVSELGGEVVQLVVVRNSSHWWPWAAPSAEPPLVWLAIVGLVIVFGAWYAYRPPRTVAISIAVGIGLGAFSSNGLGRLTGGAVDYLAIIPPGSNRGAVVNLADLLIVVGAVVFLVAERHRRRTLDRAKLLRRDQASGAS